MLRLLSLIGRHATLAMALGVFAALLLPGLAAALRPLFAPVVALLLIVTLMRLRPARLAAGLGVGGAATGLAALVWLLLLSPLLVYGAVAPLALPDGLVRALLVWSASPPLIAIAAIALILGLDGRFSLLLSVGASFLFPFVLPPLLLWTIGLDLAIGAGELALRLLLLIAGCTLAALLARRFRAVRALIEDGERADGLVVVLLVVFAITIMDGVLDRLLNQPLLVLSFLATAFAASLLLQLAGLLLFLPAARARTAEIALASGHRNMGLAVAAAGSAFDSDLLLFLAVMQFPIYLLPWLTGPLFRRFVAA